MELVFPVSFRCFGMLGFLISSFWFPYFSCTNELCEAIKTTMLFWDISFHFKAIVVYLALFLFLEFIKNMQTEHNNRFFSRDKMRSSNLKQVTKGMCSSLVLYFRMRTAGQLNRLCTGPFFGAFLSFILVINKCIWHFCYEHLSDTMGYHLPQQHKPTGKQYTVYVKRFLRLKS